jgi:hypothetical protein
MFSHLFQYHVQVFNCHACVVVTLHFMFSKSINHFLSLSVQPTGTQQHHPSAAVLHAAADHTRQQSRNERSRLTGWQFAVNKENYEGTDLYRFGFECQSCGKPREALPEVLSLTRAIRDRLWKSLTRS